MLSHCLKTGLGAKVVVMSALIWLTVLGALAYYGRKAWKNKKEQDLIREHLGPYPGLDYKSRR